MGHRQGAGKPPRCGHGEMKFSGADYGRKASKYRCPQGAPDCASRWIKPDRLHTLIPRESKGWKERYAKRGAVERTFGWLKDHGGLLPLRVRGLDRVRLHIDLTMLAKLARSLLATRTLDQRPGEDFS